VNSKVHHVITKAHVSM